ncbi:MAG TPA: HAMP domain-containing sensor histidine kinase [Caulobacteraceae bacterium]|jgi:signal transduction histidine kinase|nr:HAMP domain-containing sensor histidine kinase [Caulobacteraceae bacterium]
MADPPSPRLAQLAHELKTPLAAIAGLAEVMQTARLGPLAPVYSDYARLILAGARHALAIVDCLADPETPDAAQPFTDIVAGVVSLMEATPRGGAGIVVDLSAEAAAWPASRRAVAQILINLIDNALKASAPGGAVSVSAALDAQGLQVVVADRGGRTPPAGSGHGLAIVRTLTATLGGTFELIRTRSGARAVLVLPAVAAPGDAP